jgi:hypothetical protein
MEMYKNWVLLERHRTDYTKHGNQESRVIEKKKNWSETKINGWKGEQRFVRRKKSVK